MEKTLMDREPSRVDEDKDSFDEEALILSIRTRLAITIRRICPAWLAAQTEDIVQAAVIRILAIQKKSEEKQDLAASYLWKVAHTTVIDFIRRQRMTTLPFDEDEVQQRESLPNPEQTAMAGDLGREIFACLDGLIPKRRVAVTLYLQGHKTTHIASLMQLAPKQAENLTLRGMKQVRECLEKKGLKP